MDIILIGAQGSGKGTQAELLSKALNVTHIASGDLFRKAFDEKTELGLKAKAYIDRGELVPDEITVAMVLSRMRLGRPRVQVIPLPNLSESDFAPARRSDPSG